MSSPVSTPSVRPVATGVRLGGDALPVIAGPCVIESRELVLEVAGTRRLPCGGVVTGGEREYAARAAVVAGVDGVFVEVHPDSENALSDATTQLEPAPAKALLAPLAAVHQALQTA